MNTASLIALGMAPQLANVAGWSYSTVAAAGSAQTDATACTSKLCVVTAGDGTKGVTLPNVGIGEPCLIVNNSASNLKIYPSTITDTLIGNGTPVVSTIATYTSLLAIKATATTWIVCELATGI